MSALAAGLVLAVGAASAAAAPPPSTYVSLGDSLAFGYQPDLVAAGDSNPADYRSYAEDYAAVHPWHDARELRLPRRDDRLPDRRRLPVARGRAARHRIAGSQLAAATAYLTAHPETSLISVDIGSNDLLALISGCSNDIACIAGGLPATLSTLISNYTVILGTLHAAAPQARLVVFNLYNPLAVALPGSDQLIAAVNDAIGQLAAAFGAPVADAFSAINHKAGSPAEARLRVPPHLASAARTRTSTRTAAATSRWPLRCCGP